MEFFGSLGANVKSLALAMAVGMLFGFIGLDVPAPNFLPAITGIVGLFLGWVIAVVIRRKLRGG